MNCFEAGIQHLHTLGHLGKGVRCAHLDTGLDGSHAALVGRVGEFRQVGYSGHAAVQAAPVDSGWHGTHTAALIAGNRLSGGFCGAAPEAELYAAAVIEEGHILARILTGMDWAVSRGVKVACLSLGLDSAFPSLQSMVRALTAADVLVVCPIGNRGAGQSMAPALWDEVLTVGACDATGRAMPFSGSHHDELGGPPLKPDVTAPGHEVLSALPDGGWGRRSGTSMASALVAGVAAVLRGAFPHHDTRGVREALQRTASALHPGQEHRSRAGMTDPSAAFDWLDKNPPSADVRPRSALALISPAPVVDLRLRRRLAECGATHLCDAVLEFATRPDGLEFCAACGQADTHSPHLDVHRFIKMLDHCPIVICRLLRPEIELGLHSQGCVSACCPDAPPSFARSI